MRLWTVPSRWPSSLCAGITTDSRSLMPADCHSASERTSTGIGGCLELAAADAFDNLFQRRAQVVAVVPIRILRLELADIADPPDVIADAILLLIAPVHRPANDPLALLDRLEHRTARVAAAAHVVNLGRARPLDKPPERADQVIRMDVVADLFAFVAVHDV